MKTYLLKALGLAALFFGLLAPAAALPPTVYTIKVLVVYTDGGLADVTSRGDTALSYALRQIKYTNERYYDSGVNAVFELVGTYGGNGAFNPPVQSLVDTISYPMVNPGDIGAVKTARTDPNVTQVRDLANADYTIVVGHYKPKRNVPNQPGQFFYDDVPGYSGGNCQQSWANAIIGIDSAAANADLNILGHEFAHALCVEHSNGFALFFGAHLSDCMQYIDIMYVDPQPFPIPTVEWFAPAVMEVPPGYGTSAQNAFNDMTSHCPALDNMTVQHTCINTIPCVVDQSGVTATCVYDIDNYYPLTGIHIRQPVGQLGGSSRITSTGQCPNFQRTNLFSNPANIVNGQPFGMDPNHNAVRTMNDNVRRVSRFKP